MRITRTLYLLGAMALAAMALSAPAAAEPITITSEQDGLCPALVENGHEVTGGCHGEGSGTMTLLVHTGSAEVVISTCFVEIEGRGRSNGTGHATSATFSPPPSGTCTREPCDEPDGTFIPWPSTLVEVGPGSEVGETTFCIRQANSDPGDPGVACEIHEDQATISGHMYQSIVGETTGCENIPGVEITGTLTSEEGTEEVEVTH